LRDNSFREIGAVLHNVCYNYKKVAFMLFCIITHIM